MATGVTVPVSIETSNYDGAYGLVAELRNKKFLVVGIDYGAFVGVNKQIYLPPTVTYIGNSAMAGTGKDAAGDPLELGFWNGDDDNPQFATTHDAADWTTWNNIECAAEASFMQSYYTDMEQLFVPEKLKSFGKTDALTANSSRDYRNGCFRNSALTAVDMSKFTQFTAVIPDNAFAGCTALLTVNTGNAKRIGRQAFYQCSNLTTLTFPAAAGGSVGATALDTISRGAFRECTSLERLDLSKATALITIGDRAFLGCSTLSVCILPENVDSIKGETFRDCGFEGRFDIPKGLKYIGSEAFKGNRITYIPIPSFLDDNANLLTIGFDAFYEDVDYLTVDCTEEKLFTEVPYIDAPGGRPFAARKTGRVRVIVPISCIEKYVHCTRKEVFSSHYAHHEYRVKFNLAGYGNGVPKAQWTDPDTNKTKTAPWYIASSAWANDTYTLEPKNGGSVDTWASTTALNQEGVEKKLYTPTEDYYLDGDDDNLVKHGEKHLSARTAHKYWANEKSDAVPKITSAEVKDGIILPDEGILLTYTEPAVYLVPSHGDYYYIEEQVRPIATRYVVKVNDENLTNLNDFVSRSTGWRKGGRLYVTSNSSEIKQYTREETANILEQMKGQQWVDFRELHSGGIYRELYVYNPETKQYSEYPQAFRVEDINVNDKAADGTPMYKFVNRKDGEIDYLSRNEKRCASIYKTYTISPHINWTRAAVEGEAYIKTMLIENDDLRCTFQYNKTDFNNDFPYNESVLGGNNNNIYWVDIFNLSTVVVSDEGDDEAAYNYKCDFLENYTDNGNVLVPCIERKYVWPYYKTVEENEYNTKKAEEGENKVDIAYNHYQDENGKWNVDKLYVVGGTGSNLVDGEYIDGFISFGLSKGYFVQTKNPGFTQANRSFFRVHTSQLHSTAHIVEDNTAKFGAAVIVDESEVNEGGGTVTGITTIGGTNSGQSNVEEWYTLDGRKITPSRSLPKGIYLHGGKKVIIK